jgi:hypothetical protein
MKVTPTNRKAIQAGLIVTELMARRLAHRILIVSPAGPLMENRHNQWGQYRAEDLSVSGHFANCRHSGSSRIRT